MGFPYIMLVRKEKLMFKCDRCSFATLSVDTLSWHLQRYHGTTCGSDFITSLLVVEALTTGFGADESPTAPPSTDSFDSGGGSFDGGGSSSDW